MPSLRKLRASIGAAMEVHRLLGPGFLESVYQAALAHELTLRGIPFEPQAKLEVCYKGVIVGDCRADFLVDGKVIVEIKAIRGLTEQDEAQLINYLKATGIRVALPPTIQNLHHALQNPFRPCRPGPH